MNAPAAAPAVIIRPPRGFLTLELREFWHFRELLYFLAWRDIKVRYKQTLLGAAWAVFQPLMTMAIFSLLFGFIARMPSGSTPYPLFVFAALLPWQLFASGLAQAGNSIVNSQNLVTKVYFPRLIIPISSVLAFGVDFFFSLLMLLAMMAYYRVPLTARALLLPVFTGSVVVASLSIGLWLSALNVKYRDIRAVIPFLTQVWMYATPVAYSLQAVPARWRPLFGFNPLTGIVQEFRWMLLGENVSHSQYALAMSVVGVLFISGLYYFRRVEQTFADLV